MGAVIFDKDGMCVYDSEDVMRVKVGVSEPVGLTVTYVDVYDSEKKKTFPLDANMCVLPGEHLAILTKDKILAYFAAGTWRTVF